MCDPRGGLSTSTRLKQREGDVSRRATNPADGGDGAQAAGGHALRLLRVVYRRVEQHRLQAFTADRADSQVLRCGDVALLTLSALCDSYFQDEVI